MNKMCSRPIGETCRFGWSAFTSQWSVGRSVGRWGPLDTCPLKPSGALRAHKIRTKSTTSARGQVNARPKVRNHLENSLHRKWINNQKHTTNNKVTQNEGDIFFRDRCPWISGKNLRFQDGAWRECNWGGISLPFPKIWWLRDFLDNWTWWTSVEENPWKFYWLTLQKGGGAEKAAAGNKRTASRTCS